MFFILFAILIINSAWLYVWEENQHITLLNWYYFMLITITTVGFGDIVPHSVMGRVIQFL